MTSSKDRRICRTLPPPESAGLAVISVGAAKRPPGAVSATQRPRVEKSLDKRGCIDTVGGALLKLANALGGADNVRQSNAELVVHDHYLAMRHQRAVDEHVQRIPGRAIKLDHRALV